MIKSGGLTTLLLVTVVATGCASSEPKANPYQYTPTAEPVVTVDAATGTRVKQACEEQIKAVAKNSARETAVPPKVYTVESVEFTGEVTGVMLPYDERAWEVPLIAVNKFKDGTMTNETETCRFRDLQQDAQMLNG